MHACMCVAVLLTIELSPPGGVVNVNRAWTAVTWFDTLGVERQTSSFVTTCIMQHVQRVGVLVLTFDLGCAEWRQQLQHVVDLSLIHI